MTISRRAAAVCVALACAAALPVQAQRAFPTLRVGQSLQGRLSQSDPQMYGRGRFKVYQFRAQPGVRYVATLQSADFDAYLHVARTVGGLTDYMLTDDDGGTETNSRLRFTVPTAGTYMLVAQSLGEDGTGAFTVALDTATIRRPVARDVRPGETIRGELTDDDADYADAGGDTVSASGFYDLYRFSGRAGQRVRVRMQMEEFIPNVAVGTMEDGEFVAIQSSETSGTVTLRLPEDGTYYVQAGAYGEVTGDYSLTIDDRTNAPAPRTTAVRRGQTVTGALASGDAELDDGRLHDAYSYTGRAGERIRISMSSDEFDTFIVLGRMVDGEFQELESNDDAEGGEGTNSVLEVELPDDGRYIIQATSFAADSEGDYRLTVGGGR
ncbi:hypothetical protein [Longimicrobium sp.]|uniref:hypothetical protein n=1 Tax=Longimicrobium sp. TaxID=2029185 RepID=UPI002E346ADD|nr:hypothetical protein [Longimicrobium sp.]HEX6038342.1 hypothetical protein [Longimicrobium sp.]